LCSPSSAFRREVLANILFLGGVQIASDCRSRATEHLLVDIAGNLPRTLNCFC